MTIRSLTAAVSATAVIAAVGCGGGGSTAAAPKTAAAPAPTVRPISLAALKTYAVSLEPEIKAELRAKGITEFGKIGVVCAAVDDPSRGECLYSIAFKRLDSCGLFKLNVIFARDPAGYRNVKQKQATVGQVCHLKVVNGAVLRVP